jgi:hypothetical protein
VENHTTPPLSITISDHPPGHVNSSETHRLSLLETQPTPGHLDVAETHIQPELPLLALATGPKFTCTLPPPLSPHPTYHPYDEYGAWDGGPLIPGNASQTPSDDQPESPPPSPTTPISPTENTPGVENHTTPPLSITTNNHLSGHVNSSETHRLSLLETQPTPNQLNHVAETHTQCESHLPALAVGPTLQCTSTSPSSSLEGPRHDRATPTTSRSRGVGVFVSSAFPPGSRGLKRGPGGPLSPPSPPPGHRASSPSPSPPQRGGKRVARTDPSSRKVP